MSAARVPVASLEPIVVPKRRSLTPLQRVKLFDKHGGICKLCGNRIVAGEPWIDEHLNPREISADDSLDNRAPVHINCAKQKTKKDLGDIAKVRRVRRKHLGIKSGGRPFPGGKQSHLKRKIDGTVVDRKTGEPI